MNTRLTPQTCVRKTKNFSDYDEMTYRRGIWRLELHAYIQHYDDQTYTMKAYFPSIKGGLILLFLAIFA